MPGDCFDSFSLCSLLAYAHGRSTLSWPICERQVQKCVSDVSQVTINSRSELTGAKQGFDTMILFKFWKEVSASGGRGPLVYPEFLQMSLFKGPDIKLKSFITLRKKLVSPMNARMSLSLIHI